MLFKNVTLCLFLLLYVDHTFASQNYTQQLQHISNDEKLSQSYVIKSIQDDIGFIWIATAQGLKRFDGYEVTPFSGGFDLDKHYIFGLYTTHSGKIVVSTNLSGAFLVDPHTLKVEQIYSGQLDTEQQKFSPIAAIVELKKQFYFAIDEHVFSFNKSTKKLTLEFSMSDKDSYIRALALHQGDLYIGTNIGLFIVDTGKNIPVPVKLHNDDKLTRDNNDVKFLQIDDDQGLLIGTVEGMYLAPFKQNAQIDTSAITVLIKNLNIWDYINTPQGEFIASESGLYQYHRHTKQIEFILNFQDSKFNLSENTINDLLLDKSGLLWLASRTHGVFTWNAQAKKFKHITLPKNNIVNTIHQEQSGGLWLGTDNGITYCDQNYSNCKAYLQSADTKAAYAQFAVFDIFPSSFAGVNYLWLARFDGLALFDTKTGKIIENKDIEKHSLNDGSTYGFAEIAPDTFAYIKGENFYIFNGKTGSNRVIKGLKEKIDPFLSYTFHRSQSIYPDDLFLSTTKALYRYNEKTGKLTTLFQSDKENKLLNYTVENLYFDTTRNTLWLATTENGLIGVDPATYQIKHHFNSKNALNTDSIYKLLADDHGFLWVSSDNGLYQLNLDTLEIATYTVKNGLNNNKFGAIAGTKLTNGKLILGSHNGALLFDPNEFSKNKNTELENTLTITNISLFSRELDYFPKQYLKTSLMLNHDDMGLMVRFSSFDYQNINNTYYKVTLLGPTSLSYENLKANRVFFTKLPPGDYSLIVTANRKDGSEVSNPTLLKLNVAYSPWQSPIAYAAYLISAFVVLFLLFWQYRSRKIAIEKAHREAVHSKTQTDLALKSNKSGVWDYNFTNNTINTLRGLELGYENLPDRTDISQFFNIMHPDDRHRFQRKWEAYLQQPNQKHWQATYRLRDKNRHWLWFQDLGQTIFNKDTQEPLYVSGIFTNITEQLANEQQAKILGEAFSQINDYLLILDENLKPVSANNSFMEVFSDNDKQKSVTSALFIKAIGQEKCEEFAHTLKALKPKENWRTNANVNTTKAKQHPINISATAVANEKDEVSYYVIVITDLTEQKRAENELRYLANYDALTGLPNRSLMNKKIESAIIKAAEDNSQCAVIFIDLDKFKPVNDSFGHAVGDKLLCNITERVSQYLGDGASFGRQSGDEFLVLIENIASMASLHHTLNEMSSELASKVIIEDFSISISASIGIAMYPYDATSTDALIRNADIAMMHAKQAGRNGFQFFNEKMNEQIKQKLILENDLKDAAKDNQFFNHYQPIVNTKDKTICGVELLMRWENQGKHISPASFIPIAEETGLIDMLTEQALQRAISDLDPILSVNPQFYISLNVSPKHILKANITQRLSTILEKANIKPQQIRLEITENTLLEDKNKAAKQLKSLQTAGFKLFLDDFGTGYSSLTYLSQFPISVIKIDQSFVSSIGIDKGDESIIKTIYSLAENLELYCIAEGVETRAQLEFLQNIGCYKLQGYYFAHPMSASDLLSPECFKKIIDLI